MSCFTFVLVPTIEIGNTVSLYEIAHSLLDVHHSQSIAAIPPGFASLRQRIFENMSVEELCRAAHAANPESSFLGDNYETPSANLKLR